MAHLRSPGPVGGFPFPTITTIPGDTPGAYTEEVLPPGVLPGQEVGIIGPIRLPAMRVPEAFIPDFGRVPLVTGSPGQEIQRGIPASVVIGGAITLGIWLVRLAPKILIAATRMGWSIAKTIRHIRVNFRAILKAAGWTAAGVWLADFLNLDSNEMAELAAELLGEKKRARRYTIGHNPRVKTLQRVARHTMKLLKRHQKYIKEFFPTPSRRGELASRERAHHRLIGKAVD